MEEGQMGSWSLDDVIRLQGEGIPEQLGVLPWNVRALGLRLQLDRLHSYQLWDECSGVDVLAKCGFFCRGPGHIQCYCCGGQLHIPTELSMDSWTTDEVLTLHAYVFPTCPFLHVQKGMAFIQAVKDVHLPIKPEYDQHTPVDLLCPPLPIEKASLDIPCTYPGVSGVANFAINVVDQGQSCLVDTVKQEVMKRFNVHAGFARYELVRHGNDGSIFVLKDKHLILRYNICADCTLQVAPAGSTENRRGRPLSPDTLQREYGIRARVDPRHS